MIVTNTFVDSLARTVRSNYTLMMTGLEMKILAETNLPNHGPTSHMTSHTHTHKSSGTSGIICSEMTCGQGLCCFIATRAPLRHQPRARNG